MENTNRNDAERFFVDMPIRMQFEAIRQIERQKKPPDSKPVGFDGVKKMHDSQLETWNRVKADRARKAE